MSSRDRCLASISDSTIISTNRSNDPNMTAKGDGLGFPSRSIRATRRDSALTAPMWSGETERGAQTAR